MHHTFVVVTVKRAARVIRERKNKINDYNHRNEKTECRYKTHKPTHWQTVFLKT